MYLYMFPLEYTMFIQHHTLLRTLEYSLSVISMNALYENEEQHVRISLIHKPTTVYAECVIK